jgi:pimeloyl-ACP methyl ester carboxylesterase
VRAFDPSQRVYAIDAMGNDVIALFENLGIAQAHVIGHSMGGRIGLSIAVNFPGKIKSLIIAGGSGASGSRRTGKWTFLYFAGTW